MIKNEFELAMVNEPSMFELLRFDCIRYKTVPEYFCCSYEIDVF